MSGEVQSLLIPAVGGQGGGVLAEWIVEAATLDGHLAHGTSIPGVAQRTGSTTYYVEVAPRAAGAAPDTEESEGPIFSLYPVPGALDVLLAPEFLEVGRAIELGFPSPDRTAIIASTHRLYSIHEKITTGRGTYPDEQLHAAARAFSRTLVAFDALALARERGTEANAVLLGALAASGVLPIHADAYRRAIEAKGVQVEANLRGFDAGVEMVGRLQGRAAESDGAPVQPPANGGAATPTGGPFAAEVAALPEPLRPVLHVALARLVDYQDARYARRYLDRLRPFLGPDRLGVATIVARHLAVWMTYEDAIRVAELKTRAGRFERIRQEARAPGAVIVVTDYLKPDLDELYGVLPYRLVAPFARWAERRWPHGRPTLGQQVKTTTIAGFLRVRLLTYLKPLRQVSYRAHEEHARMERWLHAVARCADWSPALASEVARAAQIVKGYGDVRRRMVGHLDTLLAAVMKAAELEATRAQGFAVSTALAELYRVLVLQGPEAEADAVRVAAVAVDRLAADDHGGALAALGR